MFQILHRDGLGRIGELIVNNRKITTPALLPVVHPFMKDPWIQIIKELGFEGIITNSYILYKRKFNGKDIHDHLGFNGLIMTDSGTFQDYVYGGIDATNSQMVSYQEMIKSDIITIRDVFSLPEDSWEEVNKGVNETYNRAIEAIKLTDKYLALPIQGGRFPDLRAKSARLMGSLNNEYFPIGGIVPLMESYNYSSVVEAIIISKMNLKTNAVIHAFGAGHPMFFSLLVLSGADVFDSSAYIKYARDGRILTNEGTVELNYVSEELPQSAILDKYTLKELKGMDESERTLIIAKHNLYISLNEIKRIKEEIRQENLWNYTEYRIRAHPLLLEAYRKLLTFYDYLEKFESRSKRSPVFYTGEETFLRPLIKRVVEKEGKMQDGIQINKKPYSFYLGPVDTIIKTPFGNFSIYLDETYPIAQSVFPGEYYEKEFKEEIIKSEEWKDFLIRKANYIFRYQFSIPLSDIVDLDEIQIRISKNTGKLRNIYLNDKLLFSLRAEDGLFTLAYEGAKLLHQKLERPKQRVFVSKEISSFLEEGKNLFSKFVINVDDSLRPGDEVIVVDEEDQFITFGRAILSPEEMKDFKYGVAVKNRIKSKDLEKD